MHSVAAVGSVVQSSNANAPYLCPPHLWWHRCTREFNKWQRRGDTAHGAQGSSAN